MPKRYAWRRGWKSNQQYRNNFVPVAVALVGIVGVGAFVLILLLSHVRQLAIFVLVGLLGLGAILCWVIIGYIGWRWIKSRSQFSRVSSQALNTAQVMPDERPKISAATLAQQGHRVPATSLSPAQFEQEVAWVFGNRFRLQAEVVGKSNDGGIDVKLYDGTGTLVAIIQAKRYDEHKALNPSFLRELDSCKRRMGVSNAYLVTSAHFSDGVRQQAEQMHIILVDGQLFEEWRQSVYATHSR